MTENENLEEQIADDLSAVLKEAKAMGCKEVACFRHIPLQNVETVIQALEENQWYKTIGTIEEFKALKEKSVAKKPHSISIANDIGNSMVECPICHARSDYDVKSIKRGHCWKCGQKLDWSE